MCSSAGAGSDAREACGAPAAHRWWSNSRQPGARVQTSVAPAAAGVARGWDGTWAAPNRPADVEQPVLGVQSPVNGAPPNPAPYTGRSCSRGNRTTISQSSTFFATLLVA